MDGERGAPQLDPGSARVVVRVILLLGFVGLWCSIIHLLTGRPFTPAPMLMVAAFAAATMAFMKKERLLASSLNGWDEAATFLGCAALLNAMARSAAG